jgi:hypothetical protein
MLINVLNIVYYFYLCCLYVWKLVTTCIDCDVTIELRVLWRQIYGKRPTLPNGWSTKFRRGGSRNFVAGWTKWLRDLGQSDSLLLMILYMRYNNVLLFYSEYFMVYFLFVKFIQYQFWCTKCSLQQFMSLQRCSDWNDLKKTKLGAMK